MVCLNVQRIEDHRRSVNPDFIQLLFFSIANISIINDNVRRTMGIWLFILLNTIMIMFMLSPNVYCLNRIELKKNKVISGGQSVQSDPQQNTTTPPPSPHTYRACKSLHSS